MFDKMVMILEIWVVRMRMMHVWIRDIWMKKIAVKQSVWAVKRLYDRAEVAMDERTI